MTGKRPIEHDGADHDNKRVRSNNGTPAPTTANGESEKERKKREMVERMAVIKARVAASKGSGETSVPARSSPAPSAPPSARITDVVAKDGGARKAEAQIAEMRARIAAQRGQKSTASPVNGGPDGPPSIQSQQQSEREDRAAEAHARAVQLSQERNITPSVPTPPPRQDGKTAKGGLGVGIHPTLMGDLRAPTAGKGKAAQGPKFSTTKGNQQPEAPKLNPYLAQDYGETRDEHDSTYDPNLVTGKAGERQSKQLIFNQKGKFMAQANALRQQARLEEMKRRIAFETRKVAIEEASDKAFLVPVPPNVEWWDEGLLREGHNSYEGCLDGNNKIETEDSIVTALIQRPVLLQAPQDKLIPAAKPLMLTTKEQKKLRRQRRMADMKEEQAKIRLGLVAPPPAKVKKSNMMRVLGEQAVKDPTAVEARVNREIAQRESDHLKANEDRKLTKEQREEKLKAQQAADEAKGVKIAVFRVDDLSSGKHRYQVDVNAKQNALTGIVVLSPAMNLIIVEGGAHSIKHYKKLMLTRIKWGENTLPLSSTNATTFTSAGSSSAAEGNKAAEWCNPLDEHDELKDLSDNRCALVWEGDEQLRSFKRWGSKVVETDGEARDVLGRHKMENMWTLAKSK